MRVETAELVAKHNGAKCNLLSEGRSALIREFEPLDKFSDPSFTDAELDGMLKGDQSWYELRQFRRDDDGEIIVTVNSHTMDKIIGREAFNRFLDGTEVQLVVKTFVYDESGHESEKLRTMIFPLNGARPSS